MIAIIRSDTRQGLLQRGSDCARIPAAFGVTSGPGMAKILGNNDR